MRARVVIEELGRRGPRVLLLPGLGARGAGFRRLAALLAHDARPLLVEYPDGRHAARGTADLAAEVLEAAGPIDAAVASSMGGLVATHLAVQGHVRGVAYVGSFSALAQLGTRASLFRLMGAVATVARPGRLLATVAAQQLVASADAPDVVPTTPSERWGVWHRAFAVAAELAPTSLRERDLHCLAMHGTRDLLVPHSVLEKLAETLPIGTPLHRLRGAGHVPYFTHAEDVAQLLAPWLVRVRGG